MVKLTRQKLQEMRVKEKQSLANNKGQGNKSRIIVGMSSCGLGAGAQETYQTFEEEAHKKNLSDLEISKSGCIGMCHSEPTVEVRVPGMPTIIYGKVNNDIARQIVQHHVIERQLLDDHIFDKPAQDLLEN
ncbi:MAG: (2Fe-2S) ferredoxin domain-containing protein [Chlamydiota bacterium]